MGQPLTALAAHVPLLDRVLALGGDPEDEIQVPRFRSHPLDDLPPPHLLFKCALAERFEAIKAELGEDTDQVDGARLVERFLVSRVRLSDLVEGYSAPCG